MDTKTNDLENLEPEYIAVTVEGEDLTFNVRDPEAGDVTEDPTWFDIINAAVGK